MLPHSAKMERRTTAYARDLVELHEALKLIPRQDKECMQCDETPSPECPTDCPSGESCQFLVPDDCFSCTQAVCRSSLSAGGDSDAVTGSTEDDEGGGINAGAIAGGVIGGVVLIALITYLVWRFLIKPKRSELPPSIFEADSNPVGAVEKDVDERMTHRSSTHTVHSIASTVLTRASNIIQIAYIPGVTNRATASSPTVLVPPVPPIPMHHADENGDSAQDDQHFFVPGDLRDSTYSGLSDRTSYARTSYAPRSSVASTIYAKQANVGQPAQTGMRAKPTMVSVKSAANSIYSGGGTPPVPALDLGRFADQRPQRPRSAVSNFSVGSTFLNNANTATTARAQVVKVGTGLKKIEVGSTSEGSISSMKSSDPPSPDASTHESVRSLGAMTATPVDRSPRPDQGPFSDPPERPSPHGSGSSMMLGAVREEDAEDGPQTARQQIRSGSSGRENSPFADHHATK